MTAKEKAKELVDRFSYNCKHTEYVDDNRYKDNETIKLINSKECALICVGEVIEDRSVRGKINFTYWQEVKEEIKQL